MKGEVSVLLLLNHFQNWDLPFVSDFLKKVSGWQEQGGDCSSLAPSLSGSITAVREIAVSLYGLGAFCVAFWLLSHIVFLQICVIFTVFKEGKMFWIFCEVLIDFSKFVISSSLLGTISSFLSFIHGGFSWPIARSSLRFHVSYKYLSRTYREIHNLALICSWNRYKKILMLNKRYCSSIHFVYACG